MKTRAIIIIILTFVIGGGVGFFVAGRVAKHKINHIRTLSRDHKAERGHLLDKLELEGDQREQIGEILDQHILDRRDLMHMHHQQMDSIRRSMFEEIKPLLNEEQSQILDQMDRRMQRHRKHPKRPMER